MKIINVKFIQIFTDGTLNFSYKNVKPLRQITFYEKDLKNSLLYAKPKKSQLFYSLSQNFYKLKYKF